MKLLVCRLCDNGEPFACPFKYGRTHMLLHIERTHGLKLQDAVLTRVHETQSGPVLWKYNGDGESRLLLEEVFIPAPGLPAQETAVTAVNRDAHEGRKIAEGQAHREPQPASSWARDVVGRYPAPQLSAEMGKQLTAAYKAQHSARGDPHGPPPSHADGR